MSKFRFINKVTSYRLFLNIYAIAEIILVVIMSLNLVSCISTKQLESPPTKVKPKLLTSFINSEILNKSKSIKEPNYFIDYLASIWDYDIAYSLADKYNSGTSKLWNGATIFWQVDPNNNIRSGKIMLYNASNGKRVKRTL
ncbi:MAG: hypothetical protein ACI9OE_000541 [Mariniflexile sp.]